MLHINVHLPNLYLYICITYCIPFCVLDVSIHMFIICKSLRIHVYIMCNIYVFNYETNYIYLCFRNVSICVTYSNICANICAEHMCLCAKHMSLYDLLCVSHMFLNDFYMKHICINICFIHGFIYVI